jgi:hypothetical protein
VDNVLLSTSSQFHCTSKKNWIQEVKMPRFFVEVPHDATKEACDEAIQAFLATGSHFLTNADWGCEDGEHKAWFTLDVEDKNAAREILPPYFRHLAKIVSLRKFTVQDFPEVRMHHSK